MRWLQSHKLNRRLSQLIVSLLGTGSCQTGPYLIFLGYYVDFMKKQELLYGVAEEICYN